MTAALDLLLDAYDRIRGTGGSVADGLSEEQLAHRPEGRDGPGNSIAWLVWHAARVQDDHVADAARALGRPDAEQVWLSDGWVDRFGLGLAPEDTGYEHSAEQVAAVRAPAELLAGYLDAVTERTRDFLRTVRDEELGQVVDEAWDPPVTLAVRLVSVVGDDLQHVGQAAYVRGLLGA